MPSQPVALVRGVADTFSECLAEVSPDPPLSAAVARRQHAAYAARLAEGGFEVVTVAPDDAHPDCCFVEDTAVVVRDRVLITRPGHPSRRGEVGPVTEALRALADVEIMTYPACLDGGDVLQVGDRMFVGLGGRTNREGNAVLSTFAASGARAVTEVAVRGALHLKSVATALDDETVLIDRGVLDPVVFAGLRVVDASGSDTGGSNVVRLADASILVAADHQRTAELLAGLGYEVVTTPADEFARADGGLTCLSIRFR